MSETSLKITAKGQVTLRKSLLEQLGAKPGDRVTVSPLPGGGLALRPQREAETKTIRDIAGMLRRPGQPTLTIEQMNDIIARGWAGEFRGEDED
ncbi:MAG: AbrB/MazE/SpoVT family DNA-binding domain-containing protein [Acetobacteraceae bacterium]|nr:AbrB/MazE/SpoVT family DNA-binding domain-containing protein [Acetobacteraceae bacterium]